MDENFKLYVLFNKSTRQLSSFTFDITPFPAGIIRNLLIKEYTFESLGLTDENINLNRFRWVGDYDEGRLVDIVSEKKAIVTEQEIRAKYNNIFFARYKFEDVLYELLMNADMKTESGKQMQTFVGKLLAKKASDIEYFSNSDLHIWETDDDVKKRQADAFKSSSV